MIDLTHSAIDFTGSSDATAIINAALATGDDVYGPAGLYKITDELTIPRPGQRFWLSGPWRSTLVVDPASFNMAASGVIAAPAGNQPGPDIRDLGILFRQPDTAVRTQFASFPPAINLQDSPRAYIEYVQIIAGITGVAFRGNSGGSYVGHLQSSCFASNVFVEAALDTIRIEHGHIWPFGLTANQMTAFTDPANIGVLSLRCDGLSLTDTLFLCGTGLQTQPGAQGLTIGSCANCKFDSYNGYNNLGCQWMDFTGGYFTPGIGNDKIGINHQGLGHVAVSGTNFYGGASALAKPHIFVANAAASMTISGAHFKSDTADRCHVTLAAGDVTMTGTHHERGAASYGNQTVCCYAAFGARLTMVGCSQPALPAGYNAAMLYLEGGDNHVILGNSAPGWIYFGNGYTSPAPNTRIANNIGRGA